VRHVLDLIGSLVPHEQCAVLQAWPGHDPHMVIAPDMPSDERALLAGTLADVYRQLVDTRARPRPPAAPAAGVHLAVPLIGLDGVIGLLFVRSWVVNYTEEHVRMLSVVAAKLAAYFTMLRAGAELAELARERGEARRAAEAANRAKDEFLAVVSSELKTPLTSILAWAHRLRSITDGAQRAHAIDELERNVASQVKLIDGVLDLACMASAELRLDLRSTEPAGLIKATIERLRLEARRKSIQIDSELDAVAMPVVLDRERISQVVSILVARAIDFTRRGGRVEVRLDRVAGYARIQVKDSGIGISSEVLPHVFERFPQPTGSGGLGVGLAMVKDLVELHGGRVGADSAGPDHGATFTVELPRVPGVEATPESLPAGERAAGQLAGIRVLIVDHDRGLRESLQAVLEDYGAEVTAVGSAPEALAALERSRPAVLLFGDLEMRGESAYDLMRDVAARAAPLPVASISTWRLEEQERERAAGFGLHLPKPVAMGTLVDAVALLAGRTRGPKPDLRPDTALTKPGA
jgi:signal transduction histidine kinase